jgi:hypothetical protein
MCYFIVSLQIIHLGMRYDQFRQNHQSSIYFNKNLSHNWFKRGKITQACSLSDPQNFILAQQHVDRCQAPIIILLPKSSVHHILVFAMSCRKSTWSLRFWPATQLPPAPLETLTDLQATNKLALIPEGIKAGDLRRRCEDCEGLDI